VAGAVYIADGTTLARLDRGTGTLSVVAGVRDEPGCTDGIGSAVRFSRLAGLAADEAGGRLFLGDVVCHTLLQLDIATGELTTIAGSPNNPVFAPGASAEAGLNFPANLAYDRATDTLYASDPRENIVMRISPSVP
jgi:hypothetical protein